MIAHDLGSKRMSAAALTVWALSIVDFLVAKFKANTPSASDANLASMTAIAQVISHKVVHPDTTGTEGERRERNNLANHANKLVGNPVLEQLLEQLAQYASAGEADKLFTAINDAALRSSALYPAQHRRRTL